MPALTPCHSLTEIANPHFSFLPTGLEESSTISSPYEVHMKDTLTAPTADLTQPDQLHHENTTTTDERKEEILHPSELVKYKLAEPHKEMLRCRLYGDSSDIVEHFGILRIRTQLYLEKKETGVQTLVTCVMGLEPIIYCNQPSPLNELKTAESISDVFRVLVEMKIISFLQYKIVEHIIVGLCMESDELKEALQNC